MLDMFHMVGLHKFYSILIILMLVNNISLGNHAHLSSWCLRYGPMKWSLLQMFECLGNLFENFENPLRSSSLIWQVLPKPYDKTSWKPHTHMLLVVALSFSNCCDPCENFFHAFMIKIHVHANILLAMLSWELALYHLSIPQNKAPHYVLISLSLSKLILQKRHGYRKQIWTHEGQGKKEKK
jgi:hypothetical protein